jgi:hypothetical protein
MWGVNKALQMEMTHKERLKCLEQGLPLPDAELAWVATVRERAQQLTGIAIVGTIVLTGGPVAVTAIILALGHELPAGGLLTLLAILWCSSAFVLLCLIRHTMAGLLHLKRPTLTVAQSKPVEALNGLKLVPREEEPRQPSSEAIQSGWFSRPVVVDEE